MTTSAAAPSHLRQIVTFVAVGAVATTAHYAVLIVLVQLVGEPPVASALLGYCVGGLISYRLNRAHTFRSTRRHAEAVWRFAVVAGVGFLITFVLMALAVGWHHLPYLEVQIAVTGIVTVWSYAASRFWTFAASADDPRLTRPLP